MHDCGLSVEKKLSLVVTSSTYGYYSRTNELSVTRSCCSHVVGYSYYIASLLSVGFDEGHERQYDRVGDVCMAEI